MKKTNHEVIQEEVLSFRQKEEIPIIKKKQIG